MFNRVIFIGNLTKDPELRYSPQGTPICTFRLAVNSKYKQSSESKEEVLFIDIVVFGKQAEPCSQYLAKGRPALVEGRLRERRWEADGQQKSRMEVLAQTVRFLGGGRGDQMPGGQAGGSDFAPPPEETMDEPF